ncbi:MAG: hypothetical protein PHW01_05340 [Patescibacteria group bacterium]|nr:hypothetical protein [Patescibacteria group bacterium]
MSLCPVCGRVQCDHTLEERGQTYAEMMRPLSEEEEEVWRKEPCGSPEGIRVANAHAHDPVERSKLRNAPLKMETEKQEQRGDDTFLKIKVSEAPEEGGASTTVELTLHNVQSSTVKKEQGGILFYTTDDAPCILRIGAPLSAPLL